MTNNLRLNKSYSLRIADLAGIRFIDEESVCQNELRWHFSQHYFSELRGEEVIEDIRQVANGRRARAILDSQIVDEQRHAKAYAEVAGELGIIPASAAYSIF